jgi:lipid-A-disaccharide synthase
MSLRIFFSAAEVSGDVLAAALARELKALDPDISMTGLGGRHLAEAGVDLVGDVTATSVIGLSVSVLHLPRLARTLWTIRRLLARRRPDAVVLVDAPGLNFPIARMARRLSIPTIYFVPPHTWLWNPAGAVARLRQHVDLVVPVLPKEAALYRDAGLNVLYRGHPIVDLVEAGGRGLTGETAGEGEEKARPFRIGLLPGSRRPEIARLLPIMVDAVRLLAERLGPLDVVVGPAAGSPQDLVPRIQRTLGRLARVLAAPAREVMGTCDVSLAASGTVLLEAALLDAPVVMTYRLDLLTWWIGNYVVRIPEKMQHYALPNMLAGERIVPELVQRDATPQRLASEAHRLLTDAAARQRLREGYQRVREALGAPGVTRAIAVDVRAWLAARTGSSFCGN